MGGMHAQDPLPKKKGVMKIPAPVVSFYFCICQHLILNFTGVSIGGSTEVCKSTKGKTCFTRSQVSTLKFSYFATANITACS